MKRNLKELEHRIGYTFQDFALLKKAMSHSSYVNEEHLPTPLPLRKMHQFYALQ